MERALETVGTPLDHWVTLVGVSVLDLPPVRAAHLPWTDGLSVLYGVNGVGKTTVLRGVERALMGYRAKPGRVFVHLRLHEDTALLDLIEFEHSFITHLIASIEVDIQRRLGIDRFFEIADDLVERVEIDGMAGPMEEWLRVASIAWETVAGHEEESQLNQLAQVPLGSRALVLEAVGTDRPAWNIHLGLPVHADLWDRQVGSTTVRQVLAELGLVAREQALRDQLASALDESADAAAPDDLRRLHSLLQSAPSGIQLLLLGRWLGGDHRDIVSSWAVRLGQSLGPPWSRIPLAGLAAFMDRPVPAPWLTIPLFPIGRLPCPQPLPNQWRGVRGVGSTSHLPAPISADADADAATVGHLRNHHDIVDALELLASGQQDDVSPT